VRSTASSRTKFAVISARARHAGAGTPGRTPRRSRGCAAA
jgi:hypothetical protein